MCENGIETYIPDNHFGQRDQLFSRQAGRRDTVKKSIFLSAEGFHLDPMTQSCLCPAGESTWLMKAGNDSPGNENLFFIDGLSKRHSSSLAAQCMRRPESAFDRHGSGRQVSFNIARSKLTDASAHRTVSTRVQL